MQKIRKNKFIKVAGQWYTYSEYRKMEKKAIEIMNEAQRKNTFSGSTGRCVRPMGDGRFP